MTNLPNEIEVFRYLDNLRGSGITNMFGATPWIMENFHITKYDANRFLIKWMEAFSERHGQDQDKIDTVDIDPTEKIGFFEKKSEGKDGGISA